MGIGHSGLSGVRAATFDLSTIGNNVSNAGTSGFKKSTAEFADVMSGAVGGGVEVSDLRQSFTQGSIQGTGNTWDLAISGRGFFKVSEGSDDPNVATKDNYYTRNGSFFVDANGYVTNSRGMRLHMFEAKGTGDNVEFPVSTNTTEIRIEQTDAIAKPTAEMMGVFNLDARVDSRGTAIVEGESGVKVTGTGLGAVALEVGDQIELNGVEITTAGTTLAEFIAAINAKSGDTGVTAEDIGGGRLKLHSESSDISLQDVGGAKVLNKLGLHNVDESVTAPIVTELLTERLIVGSQFELNGRTITATGHAEVIGSQAGTLDGTEEISINDQIITANGKTALSDFVKSINAYSAETGVTATISGLGELKLSSSTKDIRLKDVSATSTALNKLGLHSVNEAVTTEKVTAAVTRATLVNDINSAGTGVTASLVDGAIKLSGALDISVVAGAVADPGVDGNGDPLDETGDFLLFAGLQEGSAEVQYEGTVDPTNDDSYDHSVTSIVYDTLGSKQTINTFFQKVSDGSWEVFTQRTDSLGNTYPTDATKSIKVGEIEFDGSGALSKITSGQGGAEVVYDTTVIPNVTTSTALTIETGSPAVGEGGFLTLDIGGTNQFAGKFRIVDLGQDGYSSGALTGVDVAEDGIIRASYTNGNTMDLGMVALFEFNNRHGLRQEGGVLWAVTNDSGDARPGEPGESVFGRIKSQSLESSAVDVTEELVNLITAQRNFQANSKMISASKEMNQVVLNI